MRFNGSEWLVCYLKREELDGPFGDAAHGVPVIDYIIQGDL